MLHPPISTIYMQNTFGTNYNVNVTVDFMQQEWSNSFVRQKPYLPLLPNQQTSSSQSTLTPPVNPMSQLTLSAKSVSVPSILGRVEARIQVQGKREFLIFNVKRHDVLKSAVDNVEGYLKGKIENEHWLRPLQVNFEGNMP